MAAIWFLAAVTMQRAWVVLCISRGKQNRITKTSTRTVTMGIWVAALATSAAPLLGWNNYVYEVGLVKMTQFTLLLHNDGKIVTTYLNLN